MTSHSANARFMRVRTPAAILATLLITTACGGGGGDSSPAPNPNPAPTPPTNNAPTANAGVDQAVDENTSVTLSGSGTDPDAGDTLTYQWTQTAGTTVSLASPTSATTTFMAPDVAANENLSFRLTVSDGSLSATDSVTVTVRDTTSGGGGSGDISGTVSYQFVPPNANCRGLDFNDIQTRPIRQATVQLLDGATGNVLDSTTADDSGNYAFSSVADNSSVRIRVLAELKRAGAPSWDVEVRDNVVDPADPSPPALGDRPMYAVEGSNFTFSGTSMTRNLVAETGWGGGTFNVGSYTSPRAAAPFAVLDSIYTSMQLILSVDPTADFAPLDAFWSVNNRLTSCSDSFTECRDRGELQASFYSSGIDSLFLLGDANGDTEEFDDHVIVHEWGHYFEDNFSRSDSIGGPHAIGANIDARLAFGEGWATALSGMALENQLYCDTNFGGGGFGIGAEDGSYDARGWYDEVSVVRFLYDLWDTNDEGIVTPGDPNDSGDPGSIGFAPIYNTFVGPQANTEAFTTVFSFATELRASLNSADASLMDYLMLRADMNPTNLDIWGTSELTGREDIENDPDVLPLYTDMPMDGSVINICSNDAYDGEGDGNKLAQHRYLRMNVTQSGLYDVNITTTTAMPAPDDPDDARDQSDPDIFIYRRGTLVALGNSGDANAEVFTTQNVLSAGETYVASLVEFRYQDSQSPANYPTRTCFDVSMTPQ
ncbi:MAG: hypothetical protein QNJ05_15020 [Woeseiaceae bacterium]|nr:hypothetical protein [Woeseiaceae bacterium]